MLVKIIQSNNLDLPFFSLTGAPLSSFFAFWPNYNLPSCSYC